LLQERRQFSRVDAVALYFRALRDKIYKLKCQGRNDWAMIFGWPESHPEQMHGVDHVVSYPTHTGSLPLHHIEAIMDAAYTGDATRAFPLTDRFRMRF
jgi:hypothetical protein